MTDIYRSLLADLSHALGVADAARLHGEGRLDLAGTRIGLSHERDAQGEHLWVSVDFGRVPDVQAHRVYRAMLEANLRAGGPEGGVFTLQPGGRAALLVRHPLTPALGGDLLARVLLGYAAVAGRWIADACGSPPKGGGA